MSIAASTLSVVVPAHNEAANLARTVPYLCACPYARFQEIIIVDDGSTDATAAVVRRFAEADARVRLIALPRNRGKGAAVRTGLLAATGDHVLYTDADLIYHLEDLPKWCDQLTTADIVNGNRRLPESVFFVPTRLFPYVAKRARLGLVFNRLVRFLLHVGTTDTQSGLKLYRREVAHRLAAVVQEEQFAFDLECFAVARRWGYRIVEVPVRLDYKNEISRVRLLRDSCRMFRSVFAIQRRLRRLPVVGATDLIVTADDYGMSPEVSRGILEAYERGIVNATSVLVNTPGSVEDIERLRAHPGLAVGLHLSATFGTPLTKEGRGLAGRQGAFTPWRFLWHYLRRPSRTCAALTVEWAAQLQQLQEFGFVPQHLDSHHHVHLLPGLQRVAIRLAQAHGIARVRASHDPAFLWSPTKWPLYFFGRRFAYRARCADLMVADAFRGGTLFSAADKGAALRQVLGHLPAGTTEIYCHPGYPHDVAGDSYRAGRAGELTALTDPRHRAMVQSRPIAAPVTPPAPTVPDAG